MMRWMLAAVALVGCDPDDVNPGGQIGSEAGAECKGTQFDDLGLDEVSSLGFTPQAILDLAAGEHLYTLNYGVLGTDTDLTLTVVHDGGAVEFVDYEIVSSNNGGIEPAIGCSDQVEIEVDVTFQTADGVFDEAFTTRLTAAAEGDGSLGWDLDEVTGTFDPWDHVPAENDFDEMRAWLSASFSATESQGRVHGQASGEDGQAAFAQSVDIGTFSSDGEPLE